MKFLLYSGFGEGAGILERIYQENNDVGLYIKDKVYKNVYDGVLPKVGLNFIDKDTIIIFDMSGFGREADELKDKGHFIYGASKFADDLEHDRNFGFKMMKESGILIPNYKEFTDFKSGIEYCNTSKARLVFKPNGSMPTKLTFVSDDSDQLVEYLQFVEERFGKEIDSFILQDFVDGTVISSEFFVSNGELLFPANHTIEVKKSMNDDLGPSTGCSGNITWNSESKVIENGVYKCRDFIKREKYTGQIDLNAVVTEDGQVYGLEWTPRFGYDATPTYINLIKGDIGKFFSDCAHGQNPKVSDSIEYAASVRVSIPPYPMEVKSNMDTEKVSPNMGIPIQGWEDNINSLYFYEIMTNGCGKLVHSGGTGVICLGIGLSSDPHKAMKIAYSKIDKLKIPDMQYRTDLSEVIADQVIDFEDNHA